MTLKEILYILEEEQKWSKRLSAQYYALETAPENATYQVGRADALGYAIRLIKNHCDDLEGK